MWDPEASGARNSAIQFDLLCVGGNALFIFPCVDVAGGRAAKRLSLSISALTSLTTFHRNPMSFRSVCLRPASVGNSTHVSMFDKTWPCLQFHQEQSLRQVVDVTPLRKDSNLWNHVGSMPVSNLVDSYRTSGRT